MLTRKKLRQIISIQSDVAKIGLDLGAVMQYVVEQALPLLAADGAAIELAEADDMVYRAASGIASPELGLRLKLSTSLSGQCVRSGEILTCADADTDSRVDRLACRRVGLRSMIVMPLKHRDSTVGVLKVMSTQVDKFQPCDVELLGMLSEMVAATMYHAASFDSDSLYFKATHDVMTGLANRALFMDRLRNAIGHSKRADCQAGVLVMDIDGLKEANDRHGHRVGDALIIEFARRLRKASRDSDTVARLGGDEFGMLLDPLAGTDGLIAAESRVGVEISGPFLFENQLFSLHASIGGVIIPEDGLEPEDILDMADQRMYAVKRANKLTRE